MDKRQPFKYSETEWQIIRGALPLKNSRWVEEHYGVQDRGHLGVERLHEEFCNPDPPIARRDLEEAADEFVSGRPVKDCYKESLKHVRPLHKSATELKAVLQKYLEALGPPGDYNGAASQGGPTWCYDYSKMLAFAGQLTDLIDFAESKSKSKAGNLFNGRNQEQAYWFMTIFYVWQRLGGRMATSNDPATGKPRGPLLRFMKAVAEPVYKAKGLPCPTDVSLRQIANNERLEQENAQLFLVARPMMD